MTTVFIFKKRGVGGIWTQRQAHWEDVKMKAEAKVRPLQVKEHQRQPAHRQS